MKLNFSRQQLTSGLKKIGQGLAGFLQAQPLRLLVALVLIVFICSVFIFYYYALTMTAPSQPLSNLEIKTDLAQKVITGLKQRQGNIQQAMGETWRDVFR